MEKQQLPTNNLQIINKIALIVICAYTFFAPLSYATYTAANIFDFPKWLITAITALILLLLLGIKTALAKKISFSSITNAISIPLLLISITASMLFSKSHMLIQFMGKGGLIIAFTIILFSSITLIKRKAVKYIIYSLLASSFILGWTQILSYFNVLTKAFSHSIYTNQGFTPIGSQVTLITLSIATLVIATYLGFKNSNIAQKTTYFFASGIYLVSTGLAFNHIFTNQTAVLRIPPLSIGWSIAIDQLKNWSTALFGVGPDNYQIAFTAFRPASLNSGQNWFIKYSTSTNEVLTLLTTVGVIGLIAITIYILNLIKQSIATWETSSLHQANTIALILTATSLLVIPANFASYFLITILGLIALSSHKSDSKFSIRKPGFVLTISAIVVITSIIPTYYLYKATIAEYFFGQSLVYASENKGKETYDFQIKAINNNPYMFRYRMSYSNTNLALANSLASKENITDEDKNKITILISQSIREAKAAISLNPLNSQAWVNLAQIYRQLINFAQGADQWAISSYVQAIRLDSTNPQLRVDLGGLLFSLNQYENAIDQYKNAISLKPDMANAYYNLSHAYQRLERYPDAYAAMQVVLNLVDPDSPDYEKALADFKEIEEKLPTQPASATAQQKGTAQERLELPPPSPSPVPAGPIEFDSNQQEQLQPPQAEPITEPATASQSANPTNAQTILPTPVPNPQAPANNGTASATPNQ